ncbi:hypothetical protein T439DRAFT_383965 [Meredithblackwellia eburnea MCA 4105]
MGLTIAALIISYIIGGLTLIPLLVASFAGFIFYTSHSVHLPRKTGIPHAELTPEDEAEVTKVYRAGWLTVRRTYEPLVGPNDGTYVGAFMSGARSLIDSKARQRTAKPKDRFYAILKQNTLYLHESEDQLDNVTAINVSDHKVIIYPENCIDGELFVKRNAICLRPLSVAGDSALASHAATPETTHDFTVDNDLPWFFFAKVNADKEDWYFSLVEASKLESENATQTFAKDRSMFEPEDMARLVDGIDQLPDSLQTRWLNAMLGRIFLSVYRTDSLESYITSRIVRKLKRVKTPSMLSEIQVREVNVGSGTPFFRKPMLKELTTEGDASMEMHVSYVGDFRITIETVATINLGSRFKPYSVRLVLAVVLREIEGTLLFKIKRPPSNRVWFGFSTMPRIVLNVEPVVSTRQISWSMITSPIESQIRQIILESIVVPHMDDFPFFNSQGYFHRGGIWGDALRKDQDLTTPAGGKGDDAHAIGQEDAVTAGLEDSPAPSVIDAPGVLSAGEKEKDGGEGGARLRLGRRRRSSEGDRSVLTLSANDSVTSLPPYSASNPTGSSSSASIKSGSSGTSLSSFSLSSLRELATKKPSADGQPSKRTSWLTRTTAGTSTPPSTTPSAPSLTRSSSVSSSVTAGAGDRDIQERLKDRLAKGAEERRREKENAAKASPSLSVDGLDVGSKIDKDGFPPTPTLSGLSLTAPPSDDRPASAPPVSTSTIETNTLEPEVPPISSTSTPSLPEGIPDLLLESGSPDGLSTSSKSVPSVPIALNDPSSRSFNGVSSSFPPSAPSLPSRPPSIMNEGSITLPTPPPPPPRRPNHGSSMSVDAGNNAPTTASILASWRTKASDKQAIAAGVAQAKDTMKRWGATWNARRQNTAEVAELEEEHDDSGMASGGEASSPPQDLGRSLPFGWGANRSNSASPVRGSREDLYKDYRANKAKNGGNTGDYFGSSSSSSSGANTSTSATNGTNTPPLASGPIPIQSSDESPRRRKENAKSRASGAPALASPPAGGLFTPPAPVPTTKLNTQPTFAPGSPPALSSTAPPPSSAGSTSPVPPARTYAPARMMAVPGIRDPTHKQAVAEDHVSAEQLAAKEKAKEGGLAPALPVHVGPSRPALEVDRGKTPSPTPPTTEPENKAEAELESIADDPAVLISAEPTPSSETPPLIPSSEEKEEVKPVPTTPPRLPARKERDPQEVEDDQKTPTAKPPSQPAVIPLSTSPEHIAKPPTLPPRPVDSEEAKRPVPPPPLPSRPEPTTAVAAEAVAKVDLNESEVSKAEPQISEAETAATVVQRNVNTDGVKSSHISPARESPGSKKENMSGAGDEVESGFTQDPVEAAASSEKPDLS